MIKTESSALRVNWPLLCCALCVGVLAIGIRPVSSSEVTVLKAEGEEVAGALSTITAEGVTVGGKLVKLPDIVEIQFRDAVGSVTRNKTRVILRNGDLLVGEIVKGSDTALELVSIIFGTVSISNDVLRGMAFPIKPPPTDAALESFFSGKDPESDLVLSPKGETVNGFMEKFSDKDLTFESGGQNQVFTFDKLAAFRYAALDAFKKREGLRARALMSDGSRLSGVLVGIEKGVVLLNGVGELKWKLPTESIRTIEILGGKLVHLSDLTPRVKEEPLVGGSPLVFKWRKNVSVMGTQIRIRGKEYQRGIGVHSYSKLTFPLDGKFARLLVDVGVDATAASGSTCSWSVLGDGKVLATKVAKAGERAEKLKLDVTGVKQLELICDYGPDNDDAGDHLNWAGARLIKP